MTENEIRSKMALNAGHAEGLVRGTLNMLNAAMNVDSALVKQVKMKLTEANNLFEENLKLHKELIDVIGRG